MMDISHVGCFAMPSVLLHEFHTIEMNLLLTDTMTLFFHITFCYRFSSITKNVPKR